MIKYWLGRLATARRGILSCQDRTFQAAHRELLELRERVRKAELAVMATHSDSSGRRKHSRTNPPC
jgi:hypothetical protein